MKRIERLKIEARRGAEWRNHDMTRFKQDAYWRNTYYAVCRKCKKIVYVDANPPPNGIDIAGEAIALNCNN